MTDDRVSPDINPISNRTNPFATFWKTIKILAKDLFPVTKQLLQFQEFIIFGNYMG